jgi:hypothetical protein
LSGCITAIEIARAQLLDVDVDRKKRIDVAIDYFGAGRLDVAPPVVRQRQPAGTDRGRYGRTTRVRWAGRLRPGADRQHGAEGARRPLKSPGLSNLDQTAEPDEPTLGYKAMCAGTLDTGDRAIEPVNPA